MLSATILPLGYTGLGTTWAYQINFGINHAPGAGSNTWSADMLSSVLPRCHIFYHNYIKKKTTKLLIAEVIAIWKESKQLQISGSDKIKVMSQSGLWPPNGNIYTSWGFYNMKWILHKIQNSGQELISYKCLYTRTNIISNVHHQSHMAELYLTSADEA